MLKTLSVRNAKRQARNYLIYFITITTSVALMFGLNSICFFPEVIYAFTNTALMTVLITVTSVIIVIILAWLISYMMNFMLKKRSRELSIYMILGIENKPIARMYMLENIIIGCVALIVGYIGGVLVFQVLKAIIMNLIGKPFILSLDFSFKAAGLTAAYFTFIYILSICRCNKKIRGMKLCDLLYYDVQNEKAILKNAWSGILLFCFSLICFAAGCKLFMDTPIGSGLDFPLGFVLIIMFLYGLFNSLPRVMAATLFNNKIWKYKHNHMIVFRNFTSKISSMNMTITKLSVLFTMSLFFIAMGMIWTSCFEHRITFIPFDFSIIQEQDPESLYQYQSYVRKNMDVKSDLIYQIYESNSSEYSQRFSRSPEYGYNLQDGGLEIMHDLCISFSDYSRLREMLGLSAVTLQPNSFTIHCIGYMASDVENHAVNHTKLILNGHELNYDGIYTENLDQYDGYYNGSLLLLVVPDSVSIEMEVVYTKYSVITQSPLSHQQYDALYGSFDTLVAFRVITGEVVNTLYEKNADYLDARVDVLQNNGRGVFLIHTPTVLSSFYIMHYRPGLSPP